MAENRSTENYHQQLQRISAELANKYVALGSKHNDDATRESGRLNAYGFVAHGAIVSLALSGLSAEPMSVPPVALKMFFTASLISLVLLAVDKAFAVYLSRSSAFRFFEDSKRVIEAAKKTPPEIEYGHDDDLPVFNMKLLWIANAATIILIVEFLSAIYLAWFVL